jgi:hypothetical protein
MASVPFNQQPGLDPKQPLQKLDAKQWLDWLAGLAREVVGAVQNMIDPGAAQAAAPPQPFLSPRESQALQWIYSNIPCYEGRVPLDQANRILHEMSMQGLGGNELMRVLAVAQVQGGYQILEPRNPMLDVDLSRPQPPSISSRNPAEDMDPREVADIIRAKYEYAEIMSNEEAKRQFEREFDQLVQGVELQRMQGGGHGWDGRDVQHGQPLIDADPEKDNVRNRDGSRPAPLDRTPVGGGGPFRGGGLGPSPGQLGPRPGSRAMEGEAEGD